MLNANQSKNRFKFPLDSASSVCAFKAEMDGKDIIGKVLERQQAENKYDDAIASGQGAYLLTQSTTEPNMFSMSGNREISRFSFC